MKLEQEWRVQTQCIDIYYWQNFLLCLHNIYTVLTSLTSNNCLSRSEIWSLFKHENLTAVNKIFEKNISLTSGVKLHAHLWNVHICFIFFLNLTNLICRGTDSSKYFGETHRLGDNESTEHILDRIFHWGRHAWANGMDLDQLQHLIRIYTICHSFSSF